MNAAVVLGCRQGGSQSGCDCMGSCPCIVQVCMYVCMCVSVWFLVSSREMRTMQSPAAGLGSIKLVGLHVLTATLAWVCRIEGPGILTRRRTRSSACEQPGSRQLAVSFSEASTRWPAGRGDKTKPALIWLQAELTHPHTHSVATPTAKLKSGRVDRLRAANSRHRS